MIEPSSSIKLGPLDLLIPVTNTTMDIQGPISALSVPQSGKVLTLNFEMPQSYSLGMILNKYKEDQTQLEEGQAQLEKGQAQLEAEVNDQQRLQEGAMEQKQVTSKSSGKAGSVVYGSAVDCSTSLQEIMDAVRQEVMVAVRQ